MAHLSKKIKLYAAANGVTNIDFRSDVKLQDDGDGVAYIKEWNLSIAKPTAEQIASYETAALQLQKDYDAKQYQRDRVYPSIGDQLDMLWHSIDQNPALKSQYFDFYEAIKAVKVKNPK
jgi:hypothetical protein